MPPRISAIELRSGNSESLMHQRESRVVTLLCYVEEKFKIFAEKSPSYSNCTMASL